MNNNQYIYLPGNYFGEKWCDAHKISNPKKIVILGKICDSLDLIHFIGVKFIYLLMTNMYGFLIIILKYYHLMLINILL